jgi:hypothetical protein
MAAQAAGKSHSALGGYYRRMKIRLGPSKAITATAHKLARIFYRMLRYGTDYVDPGLHYYEQKYRQRVPTNKSTDKESSTISKRERDSWDTNSFKTTNLARQFLRRIIDFEVGSVPIADIILT